MNAVQNAIGSLLALATPQSQLRLAPSGATAPDRFLIAALRDGRWLAIDRHDRFKAYLLTKQSQAGPSNQPLFFMLQGGGMSLVEGYTASRQDVRPAPDGEYHLQRSGSVVIKQGVVTAVTGTPQTVVAPAARP